MPESQIPPGTHVRVRQRIDHRAEPIETEVAGVVEAWEDLPTGSWFAHGKNDKLWLRRLKLRKQDGELVLLIVDRSTSITRVEASP